jgi:hypothetical protein
MGPHNGYDDVVGAQPIGGARRQPSPSAPGRVCAEHGCATVLSIYNPDEHCSRHSFVHTGAGAGHRPHAGADRSRTPAAA